MMYLILNETDFNKLKGNYGAHSELIPVPLGNGLEYAIGIEVLNDSEFQEIHSELSLLPQRELSENDFK